MPSMLELKKFLEYHENGKAMTREEQQMVYSFLRKELSKNPAIRKERCQFFMLRYAMDKCLRPTPLLSEVPSLLTLLGAVEEHRQALQDSIKEALIRQRKYLRVSPLNSLPKEDEQTLHAVLKECEMREEDYFSIAVDVCKLEVSCLWASSSYDIVDERLKVYFHPDSKAAPSTPFDGTNLSKMQQKSLQKAESECLAWIREVDAKAVNFDADDERQQHLSRFIDSAKLTLRIESFVVAIGSALDRISAVFPAEDA